MRLTVSCTPSLIVYCLYQPTDSSRMHAQASWSFIPWGWQLIFFFYPPFQNFRMLNVCHCVQIRTLTVFSAERRQAPKQNSTLSVCEILVCASKWSLVPPNLSRKPCVESTVMGLLRCYPDNDTQFWTVRVSNMLIFSIVCTWKKRACACIGSPCRHILKTELNYQDFSTNQSIDWNVSKKTSPRHHRMVQM